MTAQHELKALPSGKTGRVAEGTNLRTALRELGIGIESICAENATCGKCKVLVHTDLNPRPALEVSHQGLSSCTSEELGYIAGHTESFQARGWDPAEVRLSCQARVLGDVVVTVPEESLTNRQIVRKAGSERHIEIQPSLRKYLVELLPPTLANPKADWERLASGLATSIGLVRQGEAGLPQSADLTIDYTCLRTLPKILREGAWRVTASVWQDREVVRIEKGFTDRLYGAAVDIGTTTVALYLCDLMSGEILATASDMNPQIEYGEDVMSRIHFASSTSDGLEKLHKAIIRLLNQLTARATKEAGIEPDDILETTVVGNTTMQCLFLRLPPDNLGVAPFAPVIRREMDIKARDLRLLMNPAANVHVLPAIASFIGADTTGVLLAEEPYSQDENWLIIDVGTNAELVLGSRKGMVCASTPTGPAFEGAHIEFGMRASAGAIEHIRIDAHTLLAHWKLVDEDEWDTGRPRGLCGTAVIDAVAELRRAGGMDASGRLLTQASPGGPIREKSGRTEFLIVAAESTRIGTDICLTQHDVRQIQLAKGALFVAAQALLEQAGLEAPDKILLAGAFGSYIDASNAIAIGMLPEIPVERVLVVGNAAGDGARIALLNLQKRRGARRVTSLLSRYELPADPHFQKRFMSALTIAPRSARTEK